MPVESNVKADGMVKPLLVSFSDIVGGAARAAYRLHAALRTQSIESVLLVASKKGDDVHTESVSADLWRVAASRLDQWLVPRLQLTDNPALHSLNIFPSPLFRRIASSSASVVNLHWIGGGVLSVAQVARIEKPVVFTLHDMWAFCGAEHYVADKPHARFRVGYAPGNRHPDERRFDVNRWIWERKKNWWRAPRHVICPSRWLAQCARDSALLAGWPIHVIPYALDTNRFRPLDKKICREALGLPLDAPLIAFGSAGGISRDPRKGFDLLQEALKILAARSKRPSPECVVFGQSAPVAFPDLGCRVRFAGRLSDEISLALLYAAVDVVAMPSRQENLPQTAIEPQACGTPVVAFDATGIPDAVVHRQTGYLAEAYSPEDLARGLEWVLENPSRRAELGAAARKRALTLWCPEVVARQYVEVYRRAAAEHASTARS